MIQYQISMCPPPIGPVKLEMQLRHTSDGDLQLHAQRCGYSGGSPVITFHRDGSSHFHQLGTELGLKLNREGRIGSAPRPPDVE